MEHDQTQDPEKIETPLWLPETLKMVAPLVGLRLVLASIVPLSLWLLPPMFHQKLWAAIVRGNTGHSPTAPHGIETMLSTWDGAHYISIASEGYPAHGPQLAFYPLWPILVRAFGVFTGGDMLISALILTNLLTVLACLFLYDLVARHFNAKRATLTITLLLASPWAFFLGYPFSESLFLLLAVLLFWGIKVDRWAVIAVAAFLLPITRPVGMFALLPVGLWLFQRWRAKEPMPWWLCLCPALGFGAYLGGMYLAMGDPLLGFRIQAHFIAESTVWDLLRPDLFIETLANVRAKHTYFQSPLDRLAFLSFATAIVMMLWRTYKKQEGWPLWVIWALPMGMVPAISIKMMSYGRHMLVIFPVWLVLSKLLEDRPRATVVTVSMMVVLQVILVLRHINHLWVA